MIRNLIYTILVIVFSAIVGVICHPKLQVYSSNSHSIYHQHKEDCYETRLVHQASTDPGYLRTTITDTRYLCNLI